MLREGVDPTIIPTPAFRGVYQWATTYYREGGGIAPTPEVMIERFGIDFWADHQIAITDDPQETVEWAIEDLKQTFIQKEIGSFAKKLATEVATATPEERTATAAALSSELNALVQSIQPRTTHMDMRESGSDLLSEYDEILSHKGSIRGMSFGLPMIDQHLGGIWPGELAIMGGPAGTGKSFFADWVAYQEWNRGKNVVIFTLENSILMTQMRIACQALQMSIGDLQTGTLPQHEYDQLVEWCRDVLDKSDNPLHISSPVSTLRTPQSIVEISRAHEAESLIIDQLTFMHSNDRHDQRHREIAVMLHDLKEMISIGRDPLPCLLLHQISRDGVRAAARTGRLDMTHMAEGCFDDQTEIMTDKGWVLFKDLPRDSLVATLEDGERIVYQKPTEYIDSSYVGEMYTYDSYNLDFVITPNHRLILKDAWKRDGDFRFDRVDNLSAERYALPRRIAPIDSQEDELFQLLRTSSEINHPRWGYPELLAPVSRRDFASLVGIWLAEGKKSKHGYAVKITQKKKNGVKWIDDLFGRLGWEHRRSATDKEVEWVIRSPELSEYLLGLCDGHELHIPEEIWGWGREALESLLEGLMVGDGSFSTQWQRFDYYVSQSKRLVDDVQRLLLHLGKTGSVRRGTKAGTSAEFPGGHIHKKNRDMWQVRVNADKKHTYLYPSRMNKIHYDGRIYCVSVPNSTILVRRNGTPMWSGNSEVERTGDHVMSLYQSDEYRAMGRMQIQGLKHRRVEPLSWDLQWAPYSGVINCLNEVQFDD